MEFEIEKSVWVSVDHSGKPGFSLILTHLCRLDSIDEIAERCAWMFGSLNERRHKTSVTSPGPNVDSRAIESRCICLPVPAVAQAARRGLQHVHVHFRVIELRGVHSLCAKIRRHWR